MLCLNLTFRVQSSVARGLFRPLQPFSWTRSRGNRDEPGTHLLLCPRGQRCIMSDTKRNRDGKNNKGSKREAKQEERREERKHAPTPPRDPGRTQRAVERAMRIVHGSEQGSFKKPAERVRIDRGPIKCIAGLLVDATAAKLLTEHTTLQLGGPEGTQIERVLNTEAELFGLQGTLTIDHPDYLEEVEEKVAEGEMPVAETQVADLTGLVVSLLASKNDESKRYIAPPDRPDFYAARVLVAVPTAEMAEGTNSELVAIIGDQALVMRRVRKGETVTVAGKQYVARYENEKGMRLLTIEQDATRTATLAKVIPTETRQALEALKASVPVTRAPQAKETEAPTNKEVAETETPAKVVGHISDRKVAVPPPTLHAPQATIVELNADLRKLTDEQLNVSVAEFLKKARENERALTELAAEQNRINGAILSHKKEQLRRLQAELGDSSGDAQAKA